LPIKAVTCRPRVRRERSLHQSQLQTPLRGETRGAATKKRRGEFLPEKKNVIRKEREKRVSPIIRGAQGKEEDVSLS